MLKNSMSKVVLVALHNATISNIIDHLAENTVL